MLFIPCEICKKAVGEIDAICSQNITAREMYETHTYCPICREREMSKFVRGGEIGITHFDIA
jgi:hypothetical protein